MALREAGHFPEQVPTGGHVGGGGPKKPRPGVVPRICSRRAGIWQGKVVRQRQRATTQGAALQVAWQGLPWKQVHRQVCRLHKRMSRATPRGAEVRRSTRRHAFAGDLSRGYFTWSVSFSHAIIPAL